MCNRTKIYTLNELKFLSIKLGELFITTFGNLQSRYYFGERVLSIFLAEFAAAIIDFNGFKTPALQAIRLVIGSENSHHPLSQSDFPKCSLFVSVDIFLDVVSRCFIENALNVTHEKKETSRCFYWYLALLKKKIL